MAAPPPSPRLASAYPGSRAANPTHRNNVTVTRAAAFFDLDKTIIAKSSTLAFGRPFYQGGLVNRRAVLRSTYAQFVYQLGGADEDRMDRMRDYLAKMSAGWDADQVRAIVDETLHDIVTPLVYVEAVELIASHQQAGREVVIISSSGCEIVEAIGAMLGVDRSIGTRTVIEGGRYTGEIEFYAYGPNKAVAMAELAADNGYDLAASYAYTDSITDLPMLEAVGHPHVVNPDKALRKIALERGWSVLEFARPVSLRSRIPTISAQQRATAAVLLVTFAVALGYIWLSVRRRATHRM
jgi:HAD superfamily hydrolase (TIGR01490 family)